MRFVIFFEIWPIEWLRGTYVDYRSSSLLTKRLFLSINGSTDTAYV